MKKSLGGTPLSHKTFNIHLHRPVHSVLSNVLAYRCIRLYSIMKCAKVDTHVLTNAICLV